MRTICIAILTGVAVMAAGAAPASAQTTTPLCTPDLPVPEAEACLSLKLRDPGDIAITPVLEKVVDSLPPCTPGVPVPDGVNCVFEDVVWALNEAEGAVRDAQTTVNKTFAAAGRLAELALQTIDDAEKLAVAEVCRRMGIPPEECPEI